MSLNYDWTGAPGAAELTDDERTSLVFATMAVDIGDVTGHNADEFAARLVMWEKIKGTFLYVDGEPKPFTVERIALATGLKTNVATRPRDAWLTRIADIDLNDTVREARALRPGADTDPAPAVAVAPKVDERHVGDALDRLIANTCRDAGDPDLSDYTAPWHTSLGDVVERTARSLRTVLAEAVEARRVENEEEVA